MSFLGVWGFGFEGLCRLGLGAWGFLVLAFQVYGCQGFTPDEL